VTTAACSFLQTEQRSQETLSILPRPVLRIRKKKEIHETNRRTPPVVNNPQSSLVSKRGETEKGSDTREANRTDLSHPKRSLPTVL
jgi:hypothetical protein